jgi:hypothetical protein
MRSLGIDFNERRRHFRPAGLALLLAGLAVGAVLALDYREAAAELTVAEARLQRLQARKPTAAVRRGAAGGADAVSAQVLSQELRFPWNALLNEVELAASPSVALLDLTGSTRARVLRLTAEAKTIDEATRYVGRLRESPWIDEVFVSGHQSRPSPAGPIIRFTVEASWSGSAS